MDARLNGTGWGDDPLIRAEEEWEPQIPEFMKSRAYTVRSEVPVSCYCAQAVGRVKRRQRAEERQRRNDVNGAVYIAAAFAVLVFAVNLVEFLCR